MFAHRVAARFAKSGARQPLHGMVFGPSYLGMTHRDEMMNDHPIAVRARVTGRVQGVAFRAWTKSQAERLRLDGWVRNEADGAVTALIIGPAESVRKLQDALWNGPPAAEVSDVRLERLDTPKSRNARAGFEITG